MKVAPTRRGDVGQTLPRDAALSPRRHRPPRINGFIRHLIDDTARSSCGEMRQRRLVNSATGSFSTTAPKSQPVRVRFASAIEK
jgi:hypothetical protein